MGLERHWKFCKLMKLRRWCSGKETNFSTASKVLWTEEPGRLYPWGQKALDTTEHARTHRPANNGPPKLNPLSKVMHQHKFLLLQPEFVLRKKIIWPLLRYSGGNKISIYTGITATLDTGQVLCHRMI